MAFSRVLVFALLFSCISCSREVPNASAISNGAGSASGSAPSDAAGAPVASEDVPSSPLLLVLHVTAGLPTLDTTYTVERNGIIRVDEKNGWLWHDGGQSWGSLEKEGRARRAASVPVVDLAHVTLLVNGAELKTNPHESGTVGTDAPDFLLSVDGGKRTYFSHGMPIAGTAFRAIVDETQHFANNIPASTSSAREPAKDAGAKSR